MKGAVGSAPFLLRMKYLYYLFFLAIPFKTIAQHKGTPYIYILGIAQDGGYPHAGCERPACCNTRKNSFYTFQPYQPADVGRFFEEYSYPYAFQFVPAGRSIVTFI